MKRLILLVKTCLFIFKIDKFYSIKLNLKHVIKSISCYCGNYFCTVIIMTMIYPRIGYKIAQLNQLLSSYYGIIKSTTFYKLSKNVMSFYLNNKSELSNLIIRVTVLNLQATQPYMMWLPPTVNCERVSLSEPCDWVLRLSLVTFLSKPLI